jgi:hypothetical protein
LTAPNVSLDISSPADGYSEETSLKSITFVYNTTDNLNISFCRLIINGAVNLTNTSISNLSATHSFDQTFTEGTYSWQVQCEDIPGNRGNSSLRIFSLSTPATISGSGGGGGGSGGGGGDSGGGGSITPIPNTSGNRSIFPDEETSAPETPVEETPASSPSEESPQFSPGEETKKGFFSDLVHAVLTPKRIYGIVIISLVFALAAVVRSLRRQYIPSSKKN